MKVNNQALQLPRLFHEDLVWDSSRLRVVKQMSAIECKAIVKATSRKLRTDSASTLHAFGGFADIRATNAQLDVKQLLTATDKEDGEEDERGGEYSLRRKELAEESLADFYKLVESFRRDTGYRILCLLAMSSESGHTVDTVQAASAMRLLGRVQSAHLETLMLVEKIKYLHKFKSAENEAIFSQERLIQTQLLDCHLATISQVFGKIDAPLKSEKGDKPLYETYQFLAETHVEWSNNPITDLRHGESAIRVYREANKQFTAHLHHIVKEYIDEHFTDGLVFPKAA